MQFRTERHLTALNQIDWDDTRYRMSVFPDLSQLQESIETVGMLNPPLLQKAEKRNYRIVSGWRRISALQQIDRQEFSALVVAEPVPDLQLFNLVFHENISVRNFNLMEKAHVVTTLLYRFKLPEEKIINTYLPMLQLGNNPKWMSWLVHLTKFPEPVQVAFAKDNLSFDLIEFLNKRSDEEKIQILDWITVLDLSKNRQKELMALLEDLLRMKKMSITDFFAQPFFQDLYAESKQTPSQKTNRLFNWLKEQRFPNYTTVECEFQKWVHSLKLPTSMKLQHSPFFESDWFTFQFRFRNAHEFSQAVQILDQIDKHERIGVLEKIVHDNE